MLRSLARRLIRRAGYDLVPYPPRLPDASAEPERQDWCAASLDEVRANLARTGRSSCTASITPGAY